jgi:hypothetical protein
MRQILAFVAVVSFCLHAAGQDQAAKTTELLTKLEAAKPQAIASAKASVEYAQEILAKAKKGTVDKSRSNITIYNGRTIYPSAKMKADEVAAGDARLKAANARLAGLERGDELPILDHEQQGDLRVGMVASIEGVGLITQVVDEQNCIVRWGSGSLWLKGVSTAGLVDGGSIKYPPVVQITGTKQYTTVIGGT